MKTRYCIGKMRRIGACPLGMCRSTTGFPHRRGCGYVSMPQVYQKELKKFGIE